ncbi:MAG: hypothetical protein JXQ23_02120 [Clostridia bacterium]|nr:hypothetical protein [Clostridia bacterium]
MDQMNIDNELTLLCGDPYLRSIEWYMRTTIYKYRHLPADMIIKPFIPIKKVIHSTGIGVSVSEDVLRTDEKNSIVAHQYHDQFENDDDLMKLHAPEISYDKEETTRQFQQVGDIMGDIIPVKIVGMDCLYVTTWDNISTYRGVSQLLIDLVDRPEFSHQLVEKLTEIKVDELRQYEELDLFENDPSLLHCTPILTNDLPAKEYSGGPLTRKDIWGRGAAQIFSSVSKDMHEEYDIAYMQKTIGECGLSYYGCCEALDKKIDIVEKLKNLRKISITPWADVENAAEIINKRYVLSSKPNPASVAVAYLDKEALRKEIGKILSACKKNNCSVDIVLKDISSCGHRPENIFEWEQTVMQMVNEW